MHSIINFTRYKFTEPYYLTYQIQIIQDNKYTSDNLMKYTNFGGRTARNKSDCLHYLVFNCIKYLI